MAHVRKQIRDAVKARLVAIAGLNIVENIAATIIETDLPAAVVSTPAEEGTSPGADTQGDGDFQLRDVTLLVTVVLDGDIGEDEVDALAVDIEKALDDDLDGLLKFVSPVAQMSYSLDRQADEEGQYWFTFADFQFQLGVVTAFGNPEDVR